MAGCEKKEQKVSLTVENKQIFYVDSSETISFNSYKDDNIRSKATNVITYSITNPTNKKLLFVIDREVIEPMYFETYYRPVYVGFYITNQNNDFVKFTPGIYDNFDEDQTVDCKLYSEINRINNYEKLGITNSYSIEVDNYLRNSVTIYPGETRTFKSVVMLPIVLETDESGWGGGIIRYKHLNDTDNFQLFYNLHADQFKKSLPEYILNELQHNEIDIYDGKLISNKVPLKKIY
jgi:hypothetical protein